jgi:hypothetical protein
VVEHRHLPVGIERDESDPPRLRRDPRLRLLESLMTLKYYHAEPLANSLKSMLPLFE